MNQKQIALLLCSVAAVLIALSSVAIVRSESLRTEVEAKLEAQQKLLDQLTNNQLAILPLLDPDRGAKPSAADNAAFESEPASATTGDDTRATLGEKSADESAVDAKKTNSEPQPDSESRDPGPGLLRSQPLTDTANLASDDTILALASPVTLPASPSPKMVVIRGDASATIENAPTKKPPFLENVDEILVQKIVSQWHRPEGAHDGASVRVNITMERDGRLKSAKVIKSSGNKQFDQSAINAIMAVQKVPEISQVSDDTFRRLYKERTLDF
ncbi:energy transducer TonB [Pseudomonas sp. NPDC089569]|uniref:energy transducer TonB n=1 Tax=Pseudomonas sp. NPDC089569 TaxID=3390722 RepID=UPI003CFF241B